MFTHAGGEGCGEALRNFCMPPYQFRGPWRPIKALLASLLPLALFDRAQAFSGHPPLKHYFAPCSGGLATVLGQELLSTQIGAAEVEVQKRGCAFLGTEEAAYRALLWSRTANGVWQLMVRQRGICNRKDLYDMVRRVAWLEAMSVEDSVAVSCVLGGGEVATDIAHTHFSSLTVKNALVDSFRERSGGRRPSVDAKDPVLPLVLFLQRDEAWLYRSLSGPGSLHKRGYRQQMHKSSLRETTAAAVLMLAGYDPERHVLMDPMCGSGTLAIEAALMARRLAPGLTRLKREGDLAVLTPARWPDTDLALLRRLVREAKAQELERAPLPILGNDWHPAAVELAKRDAGSAGVFHDIIFSSQDASDHRLDGSVARKPNLVVCNPPWDLRLNEGARESWEALGRFLKREAGGAEAFLLSGNPDVTRTLRMKAKRKIPIDQAGMSLRLLQYQVLPPRLAGGESEGRAASLRGGPASQATGPSERADDTQTPLRATSTRLSVTPPPPQRLARPGIAPVRASRAQALSGAGSSLTTLAVGLLLGCQRSSSPALARNVFDVPSSSVTASQSLKGAYDEYASSYDGLDGGDAARFLGLDAARKELIGRARGHVLECGVGTGLNLPFYEFGSGSAPAVSLDAIDLSPGMLREARSKAAFLNLGPDAVRFREMDVAKMDFADESFDCVCDTFSLCVYLDPAQALKEMARVCKAESGRVLLLENSRSNLLPVAAYQDVTAGIVARYGGKGCVYNQDVASLARQAGLRVMSQKPLLGGLMTMLECARET